MHLPYHSAFLLRLHLSLENPELIPLLEENEKSGSKIIVMREEAVGMTGLFTNCPISRWEGICVNFCYKEMPFYLSNALQDMAIASHYNIPLYREPNDCLLLSVGFLAAEQFQVNSMQSSSTVGTSSVSTAGHSLGFCYILWYTLNITLCCESIYNF